MLSQQRALDPLSAPVHRPRVQCQLAIGLAFYATPDAVQVISSIVLPPSEVPTGSHQAGYDHYMYQSNEETHTQWQHRYLATEFTSAQLLGACITTCS